MKIKAKVHSAVVVPMSATVEFKGQSIVALVDCLEVALVTEGSHANPTFRFVGPEADEAKKLFAQDAVVYLTLSAE